MRKNKNLIVKDSSRAIVLFYLLVAFEFFYMASPFAVYFYWIYKPGLAFLNNFPAVSWITGFFLPHLVEETKSPFINLIKPAGVILTSAGFLTFLVCAFQIYYSKIFKKGIVTGGLYKIIRHPQYTAFSICSFGLLLLWPRYLALIMFITLLFVYYLLAKTEEKECESKYGESYSSYKNRTFMFLPFKFFPVKNIKSSRFSLTGKSFIFAGIYIISILLSIQLAEIVKIYSIESLYSVYRDKEVFISIFGKTEEDMRSIIEQTVNDSVINELKKKNHIENTYFVNYILPSEMYISEIPMIKPDSSTCHIYSTNYNTEIVKVIFSRSVSAKNMNTNSGMDIIALTLSLSPIAEVWVDITNRKIISVNRLEESNLRYSNIPEPIF